MCPSLGETRCISLENGSESIHPGTFNCLPSVSSYLVVFANSWSGWNRLGFGPFRYDAACFNQTGSQAAQLKCFHVVFVGCRCAAS